VTARLTPPFRADHVGSLLRPAALHAARAGRAAGRISAEELTAAGFASTVEGNSLTIDEERAKLELIASVAEEIWGRV
jgi:5-methyltetrahydropteroyltriglutamate--homocysteine methyltransferase